jgi:hypothetical protein
MNGHLAGLAYFACAALITAYAWNRFNTPTSNRSSTLRALYWWSCLGYIMSALVVFIALSLLLELGPWRTMLLGHADNPALPAPLIATLAMTTMLSSVPALKTLDGWILAQFHEWGAIPAEAKRRAAGLTTQSFRVQPEDVAALRDAYGDGSFGEHLSEHFRADRGEGLALSQYRLTAVVKLYDQLRALASVPRYGRFFAEAAEEWDALDQNTSAFTRKAAASLTVAARLRAVETEEIYEELMRERREQFAQSCRETFRTLALFLARAVLRSEPDEQEIVRRLRTVGFTTAEPMGRPQFPIDSLTVLALWVFLYLVVLGLVFSRIPGAPHPQQSALFMASKIALVRLGSVAMTIWLMQRFAVLSRPSGGRPRYSGYVLAGLGSACLAGILCLAFHLADADPFSGLAGDKVLIGLSWMLCTAIAYCCDDWPIESVPPASLRIAEAIGCGAVMAAGAAVAWLADAVPFPASGWMVAAWITLPSLLAMALGGWVPHIYRTARRAAGARREEIGAEPSAANRMHVTA